jgi:hypothetical protein
VHFKHKYITQPTLTPKDTIVKALSDLTHALKEQRNKKGNEEMEALRKLDKILQNIPPKPAPHNENLARVTFDSPCKPPQETQPAPRVQQPQEAQPAPRVQLQTPAPRVQQQTQPSPRVKKQTATTPRLSLTPAAIDKPIVPTMKATSLQTQKLREHIKARETSRARIPHRHQMNLRCQNPTERVQLLYDQETKTYLNYRQLICNPKYKEAWL